MKKTYISPRCEVIEFCCAESACQQIVVGSQGEGNKFSNRRDFEDAPSIWDSCNWDGTDEEE